VPGGHPALTDWHEQNRPMQTSCPACRTTFRVHQDQLGLRRGLVRCGTCNAVFNAYDTLLPELESVPADEAASSTAAAGHLSAPDTASPASESEPKGPEEVLAEADPNLSILTRQALSPYVETAEWPLSMAPSPAPPLGDDVLEVGGLAPAIDDTTPAPEPESAAAPAPPQESPADTPDAILLSELPTRKAPPTPAPLWKTALYAILILALTATLLGQLAYFLRAELAAALPASRPVLETLCQPLGCTVPMPQGLTRQAIVSSSLEHDVEQKSRVRLTFLLANRTSDTQAWPHVLLTLSDLRESPVAQKAFPPEDYLPKGISPRAGFPPLSEQEIRRELDIGNLSAASYLLDVAYP